MVISTTQWDQRPWVFNIPRRKNRQKKQSVVYDHLNKVCITYKVDRKKPWSEFVHSSPLFLVIIFQE